MGAQGLPSASHPCRAPALLPAAPAAAASSHSHPAADSQQAAESPKPLSMVQSLSPSSNSPLRKLPSLGALPVFPRDCCWGLEKGRDCHPTA